MNIFKKIAATVLAAAITAFSCAPAVKAEGSDISDTVVVSVPEIYMVSASKFSMNSGTSGVYSPTFATKTLGAFSKIVLRMSGGTKDLTVETEKKTMTDIKDSYGFVFKAAPTAAKGKYDFTLTAEIYDIYGSLGATQTFAVQVEIVSTLAVTGMTIESCVVSRENITPGDKFDLTVTIRNNCGLDVKDAELELSELDKNKFLLDTGFSMKYLDIPNGRTGSATFTLVAQEGLQNEREYIGVNLTYCLEEGRADLTKKTTASVAVSCKPKKSDTDVKYSSHALTVSRYTVTPQPVADGTKFTLDLDLKNNDNVDIKSARVSVEADGTKFAVDSGLSYRDLDLKAGETKKVTFSLMGASGIANVRENIPIKLDFGTASVTETVVVTCTPAKKTDTTLGKYDLTMTGYSVDVPEVREGTIFTLTLTFTNSGKKDIDKARVTLGNLDGTKFAADSGLSFSDMAIKAGETKTLQFRLIGCKGLASVREAIGVQIDYGEVTSTVYATVKCVPKDSSGNGEDGKKVFAPNIIITNYTFGGDYVTAGQKFPLMLEIENMSTKAVVENLKVTISGGATGNDGSVAYSPANSSNSFFFDRIDIHEQKTLTMELLAKADAVPNSYPVDISFAYEYSVGDERYQASAVSSTLSIPLRQEDRLEINEPEIPTWGISVGEQCTINVSLVNKGKSDVYNVSATVEGDGFSVETPTYYIGNIKSGTEEYYDAKLTPFNEGEISGEIVFTYEDANSESKESRIPFTLMAQQMMYDPGMYGDIDMGMDEMPAEETGMPWWVWLIIGGGAALVIIIVIVVIVKHKKKKAELIDDDEDN